MYDVCHHQSSSASSSYHRDTNNIVNKTFIRMLYTNITPDMQVTTDNNQKCQCGSTTNKKCAIHALEITRFTGQFILRHTPCTASDNGACLVRDMAYPSTHHGTAHMFITPTLASDRLQLTITYIDPAYNSKQHEH